MENKEWLTTQEAADALGCSARHLRNMINDGQLWAERDGKNWRVHASLQKPPSEENHPTEADGNSNGRSAEVGVKYERVFTAFEEQIRFLKEQMGEKDRQIQELVSQNEKLLTLMAMEKSEKKAIAETAQSLEGEVAKYKLPWWQRVLNR